MMSAVNLETADGHFNLPQEFNWFCMSYNTHFITPRAYEHFYVYLTPFCKLQSDKKMRTKLQSVSDVVVREGNQ